MSFNEWTLSFVDMQGYRLSSEEKQRLNLPIRFAPAVCSTWAIVALIVQPGAGLLALAVIAGLGAVLPAHPFDYLYRYAVDPITGTGPAPRNTAQRRFACTMGATMLGVSGFSFLAGQALLGWVAALSFLAVAVTVATTHWCLPSLIYNHTLARWLPPA